MEPNRPRFALQCGWVTERIVSLIANSADRVRAEPLDLDYNTCDVAMDEKRAPLTFILCIEGILLALLSTKEPVDSLNSMMNTVFLNFIKKRISLWEKFEQWTRRRIVSHDEGGVKSWMEGEVVPLNDSLEGCSTVPPRSPIRPPSKSPPGYLRLTDSLPR